jgi:isoamylase
MLIDGHAQKTGIRRRGADASVLIVMNSFEGPVEFTLPKFEGGEAWNLLVDTNIADGAPGKAFAIGNKYQVTGRSLLLFAVNPESERRNVVDRR